MVFTIDSRKSSFVEMKGSSIVELCWYFPLTKEQFKLRCRFESRGHSEVPPEASKED